MRRPDYTIDENARDGDNQVARFYKRWFWHRSDEHPADGRVELLIGKRTEGHGWGVVFGRNGSDSDVGLDVYAGRILSMWARLRAPRTRRFRDPNSYNTWHYGVRIRPHGMAWFEVLWHHDPMGSSRAPGRWTVNKHKFLGKQRSEKELLDFGVCQIPMPEGVYPAEWKRERFVSRYVGRLGKLRDRLVGPRIGDPSYWISIPGGIPVQGKGENSWDCGMDGIFGTGGPTLETAIGNVVAAATRGRQRYGGPHNLTKPTSVAELDR